MAPKSSSHGQNITSKQKGRQGDLPVPIHPDDAKDKVFTAIMKALLKMGNKPSSPKELANVIVKHNYATLGGATPFATVSSRISQHFKRAAEHNPPRPPILTKHIDQNHSRKINYSLATEPISSSKQILSEPITSSTSSSGVTIDASIEDSKESGRAKTRKSRRIHNEDNNENQSDGAALLPTDNICHPLRRDSDVHHQEEKLSSSSTSDILMPPTPPHTLTNELEEESDGECSDYHEDMLKGDIISDENHAILHVRRASRRQSHVNDRRSSLSFSLNNSSSGEQEFWTPFSFEQDFDNLFLQDASLSTGAHSIPFNIDTPESVSVSELDNYFDGTSPPRRSQRKSLCASMPGSNDKSLLQKVLLASAARGVAEKKEEDQSNLIIESKQQQQQQQQQQLLQQEDVSRQANQEEKTINESNNNKTELNSDLMSGEDFVKFDDEEPLPEPPLKKLVGVLPATTVPVSTAEILKSMNIQNLNLSALHNHGNNGNNNNNNNNNSNSNSSSSSSSVNITVNTNTSIINNNNSNNTASTSQKPSPAFDLTKTMAAYLRALAKSANENSSSSSTLANDLKSILARFPALEAYIKKEPTPPQTTNPTPSPSPTTELVPNLVQGTDPIVQTINPMQPPMYITTIDMIAVCVVILEKANNAPEYRIMRRLDNGFINGTVLLTAGGIETESERSMILSFEMERVRVPKKESKLFGTWIPLRRAQELAATCSLQNKLDRFLDDNINSYFPDPLPIQVNSKKTPRDNRWAALALAALRNLPDTKPTGFSVPPISQSSSCSYNASVAQLQQLLLNNPQNALKSSLNTKNPLLETANPRTIETPSRQNSSFSSQDSQAELDFVNNSDLSSDEERTGQKKQRSKKRDHHSSSFVDSNITKIHDSSTTTSSQAQKRRRKNTGNSDNMIPCVIKESTTTVATATTGVAAAAIAATTTIGNNNNNITQQHVSKRQPSGGKSKIPIKHQQENLVVEHKPSTVIQKQDPVTQSPELSEDEDIDIGGSDCDDDLR